MFSDFGISRKAFREVKKQGKFVKIEISDDHLEKVGEEIGSPGYTVSLLSSPSSSLS
jgi:hypothetical protein